MRNNVDFLTIDNMDIFYPINQKKDLIKRISKEYLRGNLVDLGCGRMPYKSIIKEYSNVNNYVGIDIENEIYQKESKPDLFWDGNKIPVEDNLYDSAILIEVLEHTPEPNDVIKELNRVLKVDGYLLITVPFLWTLHDIPYDEYRYTPFGLERILIQNGFEVEKMECFGGWNASMASMISLYVKRGVNKKYRKIFSRIMLPLVKYLMKKDQKSDKSKFYEGQMITGIWCLAKKKDK